MALPSAEQELCDYGTAKTPRKLSANSAVARVRRQTQVRTRSRYNTAESYNPSHRTRLTVGHIPISESAPRLGSAPTVPKRPCPVRRAVVRKPRLRRAACLSRALEERAQKRCGSFEPT